MQPRIKLNRQNIKDDKLREIARKYGFGDKLLDDKTLLNSRRKLIPDNFKDDVWLFGYGSLIWNPVVKPIEKRNVQIFGYRRKYCLKSEMGRGSKEYPGLVLGLNSGGSTLGQAIKINTTSAPLELDLIWRREMITGAYIPKILKGYTVKGEINMIAFVINKSHENYLCSISEAKTALMISKAQGYLGTACEYLNKTCESLKNLGLRDSYLERLQKRIISSNFS
jgi:cation transport protein ChaC